jgi:hypothetical protein
LTKRPRIGGSKDVRAHSATGSPILLEIHWAIDMSLGTGVSTTPSPAAKPTRAERNAMHRVAPVHHSSRDVLSRLAGVARATRATRRARDPGVMS